MRRLALAGALLVVAAACGDDTTSTTGAGGTTQPGATSTSTTSGEAATTTTAPEPFVPGLGLESITLTTPLAGGGPRPLLSWDPINGAAAYTVVVFDADGTPWWSWHGAETEAVLGGIATDAEIGGPRAGQGVTWVVFAFDAAGAVIGVSEQREIDE